ncbi:LRRC37A3: Leucine-rich repeat-containing protein 37A3, partial [Crotalus adamanteus]
ETLGEFHRPPILKSVSRLNKPNLHKYLDEKGSHENLLKRLYKSPNALQMASREKITENSEGTQELDIQKALRTAITEASGDISLRTKSPLEGLKSQQNMMRQFAEIIGKLAGEQVKLVPYRMVKQWWKPVGQKGPMEINRQTWVSPKAQITDNVEKKYDIQKKVATEIFMASGAISLRNESPLESLRSNRETREDHELGKNPRG